MAEMIQPKLKLQQVVPAFTLRSTQGVDVPSASLLQRHNLVLVFFYSADDRSVQFLRSLARRYDQIREANGAVLAVSTEDSDRLRALDQQLQAPFPLLSDATGRVVEHYTFLDAQTDQPVPSVFIADRFGALYAQVIATDGVALPAVDEVVDWLNFIEVQCPECGVAEWPGTP